MMRSSLPIHYSACRDSRKKLKEVQKVRGFYKSDGKGAMQQSRGQAKQIEKERNRYAARGRLGHWAGDRCSRTSRIGPKQGLHGASEPDVAPVSPSHHQAFMVEGKNHNSVPFEPNDVPTSDHKEFKNASVAGHHFGESRDEVNEGRLCLLDTACISCMHSKRWREEYQKTLPDGVVCAMTPSKKVFHFATGQST